MLAPSDSCF